jgi:hypothetical protein
LTLKKKKAVKFRFRVIPFTYEGAVISYNFTPSNQSPNSLSFTTKTFLGKKLLFCLALAVSLLLNSSPAISSLLQDLENFRLFLDHPLLVTS